MESPDDARARPARVWTRLGVALELALFALAWSWTGSLAAAWADFGSGDSVHGLAYLRWAVIATPLWVALVGLALAVRGRPPAAVGWSRPFGGWARAIGVGLLWGALLWLVGWVAGELAARAGLESDASAFSIDTAASWAGFLAGALLAGAFGEELVYRGYALERVERLLEGLVPAHWATRAAIVATALAFGASHAWQGGAAVAVVTVMGVGLGTLFVRSGRNLVAAMVAHGVLDVVALTALHLGA